MTAYLFSNLNDVLLGAVTSYGAPLLGLLLMLGALGIPFPTTLLVVSAGIFIQQGKLEPLDVVLVGLFGTVIGDSLSFALGRMGQGWLLGRLSASNAWQRARVFFLNRGGLAIYLSRWLLPSIAIPTNLVAGGTGYHFARFLFYDSIGETTWIALFGCLGYWFGSQEELIEQFITSFGGLALCLAIASLGIYLGVRKLKKRSFTP
jgi:membrane-associated protein